MNILVHLNESSADKQLSAINNILHSLDARGGQDAFELVTHGPGTSLVIGETKLENELQKLFDSGVAVTACHNSLASLGRNDDDVLHGVITVPSGMAHLIERQAEGWGYIKI